MRRGAIVIGALVTLAAFVPACLPADDRPPPGSVTFTVSPSASVRDGVTTADGWHITFSRLLLDIGRTSLGDGCTEYAEARYDRLLDVTKGSGQRLSILYGLGRCDLRFRIAPPTPDVLLGAGVTTSDKYFMGTNGKDAYTENAIAVWVEGRATKDAVTKTFQWAFRKGYRFGPCRLPGDAGLVAPITLVGNVGVVNDIEIEGETLFRDEPKMSAELRFAPFAAADDPLGNGDGRIDLDELARVPLALADRIVLGDAGSLDSGLGDGSLDGGDGALDGSSPYSVLEGGAFRNVDGSALRVGTLRDYVYVILVPTLPNFEGNQPCAVRQGGGFR